MNRHFNLIHISGIVLLICLFIFLFLYPSIVFSSDSDVSEELISAGARTYHRFCSVCHGENAKGNGPFADNIKVAPPNLTELSANNNGFPWVYLYGVIDGNNIAQAHGTKEMPIWGDLFDLNQWSSSNIENANTIVHGRIFELLMYLNSIQVEK